MTGNPLPLPPTNQGTLKDRHLSVKIDFAPFLGELPQFDPSTLPTNNATRAFNVRFDRNALEPVKAPLDYRPSSRPKTQNTVYRFAPTVGDPLSGWLFSWEEVVHVIPGPVSGNDQELTYFTGLDVPRFLDNSVGTGDGVPLPRMSYVLGVPAPEFGPHVELVARPPEADEREWDPEVWYGVPPVWWPKLEPVFWPDKGESGYFGYINAASWPEKRPEDWPATEPQWWPTDQWPPVEPEWFPKPNSDYPKEAPDDWPDEPDPPYWWPKKDKWQWKSSWPAAEPDWWPPVWDLLYTIGGSDARDEVDRDYVVTFTAQLGSLVMEGPPSDPSRMITVTPTNAVQVSNIPTVPSGNYPWHGRRLYRRIYSSGITKYALVAELGLDESLYVDSVYDAELPGDDLVSTYYDPPPEDLHSLNVLSNGLVFGASKNDVCLSEPYLPHAWNPFARYPFPHPVEGVGISDNNIVVVTQKNPYLLTGVMPSAMSSIELHLEQGCIARRSIASGAFGCCYASPDGLVVISGSGSGVVTEGLLTQAQWQALNPPSMITVVHEDTVIITYTKADGVKGTMLFNPQMKEAGVRFTKQTFTAAYRDALLDSVIIYDPDHEGRFSLWDRGEPMNYVWRSKLNILPKPLNFTAFRVEADSYDNTVFRLVIDGGERSEVQVLDSGEYRLPAGYTSRYVQVEVEGTDLVRKITIAEAPHELT